MAKFTEGVPTGNAPSYIGLSQGIDRPKADDTLGTLFKGLGNVIDVTTKALDQRNETKIDQELTKGIDAIRGEQGVDMAVNSVSNQTAELIPAEEAGGRKAPPQIDNTATEVNRLTSAYKEGKISDTQYWSKVESLTRSVRARYPGYRDEIDKKVSSITGTTPANALRRSLLESLEQGTKKEAAKVDKLETFVKQNLENISPELRNRYLKGERGATFEAEVVEDVAKTQSNTAAVTRERARIGLAKEKGDLREEDAIGVATAEANQFVNRTFNDATGAAGAGGGQLFAKIESLMKSGKTPSPEEQAAIRSQFALYEAQVSMSIDKILTSPLTEGKPDSYSSIIKNDSKIKGIKETALARIRTMKELLVNGDYGLFAANLNYTKASEDANTRKVLESSEAAQKLQAAKKLFGENLGVYLTSPGGSKVLNDTATALNNLSFTENVTTQANPIEQLKRLKESQTKKPDPAAYKEYLSKHSRALGDPTVAKEALVNLNKSFYDRTNDNFISQFASGDRPAVYAQLTTPEITKNMLKLKETDPESWNRYKNWAVESWNALNRTPIDSLASLSAADTGFTFSVDPKTGKLAVIDMKVPSKGLPFEAQSRRANLAQYETFVNQINRSIDSIDPILKAEGVTVYDSLQDIVYKKLGVSKVKGDKESGNGETQEGNAISLGNTIQLASYSKEDNLVPGPRDDSLEISLAESDEPISLSGPTEKVFSTGKAASVLDIIGRAEAPKGYNQIFGNNRMAPLDQMSVSDVLNLQRRMRSSGSESSAVGRYQFIYKTLKGLVNGLGIDPDEKFTPQLQDKLATALMQRRGLNQYLTGKISKDEFADRLAKEWAGLPLASGRSFYKGVGSNNATVRRQAVLDAIDRIKVDE